MSSSPPSSALRWRPAGWSLRTRLVVALVVLVAGVCAVIGVGTTVAVYQFQVRRLDSQLTAAVGRTNDAGRPPDRDNDRDDPTGSGRPPPVQNIGTITNLPGQVDPAVLAAGGWQA